MKPLQSWPRSKRRKMQDCFRTNECSDNLFHPLCQDLHAFIYPSPRRSQHIHPGLTLPIITSQVWYPLQGHWVVIALKILNKSTCTIYFIPSTSHNRGHAAVADPLTSASDDMFCMVPTGSVGREESSCLVIDSPAPLIRFHLASV